MFNKKNTETNKPTVFINKLNTGVNKTPFFKATNTLGLTTYFPPTNQEWNNSIYVYNSTSIKSIPSAQDNLSRLIENYFNIYFTNKLSNREIDVRKKRSKISKILVSKAELKHTSDSINITLYVYNEEKRIILSKLKRLRSILFPSAFISNDLYKSMIKNTIPPLGIKLNSIKFENTFFSKLIELSVKIDEKILKIEKIYLKSNNRYEKEKMALIIKNLKNKLFKLNNIIFNCEKEEINKEGHIIHYNNLYNKYINKTLLQREIISIAYYKLLLTLNSYKFEDYFLSKLEALVKNIYNKKVEFNIVNIKAIYLNSDIFTKAISLKLKNRKNRLLKVLNRFIHLVKLPKPGILTERYAYTDVNESWNNKVKNTTVKYLPINSKKDNIDKYLKHLFSLNNFINDNFYKENEMLRVNKNNVSIELIKYFIGLLKHKTVSGVRLEAKGRLSKRFTASRSVFKIKWIGSLKNIYSSYRGISSVMLKGHSKPNIQYSLVNSKTRIGAFGLKGWIAGR